MRHTCRIRRIRVQVPVSPLFAQTYAEVFMLVPSQTRLGWLQYSHSALRLLVAIEALSHDGWTEPITQAALGRAAHIQHRQTFSKALDEIASEIGITRVSARRACYGLRCLFEAENVQKVNAYQERSENERSDGGERAEDAVQKVNAMDERSENERLQSDGADGGNVQKMNTNEDCSKIERSGEVGPVAESVQKLNVSGSETQPIVHKTNGFDGERSKIERSDGEPAGVKDSFTESDSPDQPDQDAPCDNGDTPAVAADMRVWLRLSIDRIKRLAADGGIPRGRMLELATAEQAMAVEEQRELRRSLVQWAIEFHYSVPAVESRRMFGAICEAFGFDSAGLTDDERGVINKTAAQLVKAGRRPEDVATIYAYCARQNWSGGFKPSALLSHASAALAGNGRRRDDPNSEANRNRYTSGRYADIIEH